MRLRKICGILLLIAGILVILGGCNFNEEHVHSFTKWAVTKQPGCVDPGVQSRECEECGYIQSESIASVGHTTVKDAMVKATCTEDGWTEGSHCSVCGAILLAQERISAFGHAALVDYAVKATCTTDGLTEGSHCYICGVIITAQEVVPATGHAYDEGTVVTPANCMQIGTKRFACLHCDISYLDTYATTEHTLVVTPAVAATCTTDGLTEGSHCSVCMTVFTQQQVVFATGHNAVLDAAVELTCTTDGLTEGSHCSICNEILVPQQKIPATGHQNQETVLQEATCKMPGLKQYFCQVCGELRQETFELPMVGEKELYDAAVRYVAEIVTYDKNGKVLGNGLGFVISQDGKILTNYQTIAGAYTAQVTVNGTVYPVMLLLSYSESLDLAVLKVEASDLATAVFCTEVLEVGDAVYALAAARGMSNTYTQGMITGENLQVLDMTLVLHDAVVTVGNTGGPLLNAWGEVIGINSAALSQACGYNVALAVSELEKLDYSRPITLAQLYQQNTSAYQKLVDAILANGSRDENGNVTVYGSQSTVDYLYVYELVYDSIHGQIWLTQASTSSNGQKVEITVWLTGEAGAQNYQGIFCIADREYNRITGTLDAATYTAEQKLQYATYEGMVGYETTMMSLYNPNMVRTMSWLNNYLVKVADITMADMGFLAFQA